MTTTDRTSLARAVAILDAAGILISERREIPHGTQLRLDSGAIANVYTTGAVVVQGPSAAAAPVRKAFEAAGSLKSPKAKTAPVNRSPGTAAPAAPVNEPQAPSSGAPFLHPRWSDHADPDDDTPPW